MPSEDLTLTSGDGVLGSATVAPLLDTLFTVERRKTTILQRPGTLRDELARVSEVFGSGMRKALVTDSDSEPEVGPLS